MSVHPNFTNDPVLAVGKQLHIPGFTGTSAQRVANTTAVQSDQWYETDTGLTYQFTGTAWQIFGTIAGSSGSVISGPLIVGNTLLMSQRLTII